MYSELDSWQERIAKHFNQQEGQPYPCSNQVVICGFITEDDDKWKEFIDQNKDNIQQLRKEEVRLKNGERWIRVPISDSIRGYRYYKAKVDRAINEKFLKTCILPCCAHYCCNFEWI